jgi:Integrase zinc binding domain/RNase H-like domain found in reverse transcriptase
LDAAQRKYSAFDRELLAAYLAVRHFCFLLEGRQFTIYSDHKPLSFALSRVVEPWSARQQRHLAYIAEFTSDIQHVPGAANVVTDTLSRPAVVSETRADLSMVATCPGQPSFNRPGPQSSVDSAVREPLLVAAAVEQVLDIAAMAAAQSSCTDCMMMQQLPSLAVKPYVVSGVNILCDFSTGSPRPLVPAAFRAAVFSNIHSLAHPGVRGTRRLVSRSFVWPGMSADISQRCRSCVQCARNKVHAHVKAPVQPIAVPPQPFNHIHVTLWGRYQLQPAGK